MSRLALEVIAMAECPATEKLVLQAVAVHGDRTNGSGGWPGVRRIARMAGIAPSTTWVALKSLEAKGWLSWTSGNPEAANVYTIHLNAISTFDKVYRLPIQGVSATDTGCIAEQDRGVSDPVSPSDTELKEKLNTKAKTLSSKGKPSKSHKASQENFSFLHTEEKSAKGTSTRKKKSARKNPPKKKPANPKHAPFWEDWAVSYKAKNNRPVPEDGQEHNQLARFLNKHQSITQEEWRSILRNRERSPVAHLRPLSQWISHALSWLNDIADDYGRPITGNQAGRKPPQKISEIDYQAEFGPTGKLQ